MGQEKGSHMQMMRCRCRLETRMNKKTRRHKQRNVSFSWHNEIYFVWSLLPRASLWIICLWQVPSLETRRHQIKASEISFKDLLGAGKRTLREICFDISSFCIWTSRFQQPILIRFSCFVLGLGN